MPSESNLIYRLSKLLQLTESSQLTNLRNIVELVQSLKSGFPKLNVQSDILMACDLDYISFLGISIPSSVKGTQ